MAGSDDALVDADGTFSSPGVGAVLFRGDEVEYFYLVASLEFGFGD